ncbi:MAG: hypothetical protein DMG14_33780 [Acidobacteria bacterium]|nr:MAG: hypothetical protein DMG14_33780 [Acidobacteriota bacterium]
MTRPVPPFEKSVFVNCPFDSDYPDLMLAIVFSVAAHGFVPRTARESEGDPEPRFSRILRMISQCKYSIHDLSRSTGEGADNLARFNMPSNSVWPPHFAEALNKDTWADVLLAASRTVPRP